jgi:hypothetical protein
MNGLERRRFPWPGAFEGGTERSAPLEGAVVRTEGRLRRREAGLTRLGRHGRHPPGEIAREALMANRGDGHVLLGRHRDDGSEERPVAADGLSLWSPDVDHARASTRIGGRADHDDESRDLVCIRLDPGDLVGAGLRVGRAAIDQPSQGQQCSPDPSAEIHQAESRCDAHHSPRRSAGVIGSTPAEHNPFSIPPRFAHPPGARCPAGLSRTAQNVSRGQATPQAIQLELLIEMPSISERPASGGNSARNLARLGPASISTRTS